MVFITKKWGLLLEDHALIQLGYAVGLFAVAAEWWAYHLHCGIKFRQWSAIAALLWALQYLCLGAISAAVNMALTALRTLLSGVIERSVIKNFAALLFCVLFAALTAASWQGWSSLLPAFAVINTTLAQFYLGNKAMRITLLFSSLAWMSNDLIWQAWPALLAESVAILINLRSIAKMTSA